MPNDNDLIERYLYAITRHLPSAQRSDVAEELRTLISDMLDERCGSLPPTAKDVRVVLTELGTPGEMVRKYTSGEGECLIGQPYYAQYLYVDDLPPVPRETRSSTRGDAVAGIVFSIVGAVVFLLFPDVLNALSHRADGVPFDPFNVDAFRASAWVVVVWTFVCVAGESFKLVEGRYTKRVLAVTFACDLVAGALVVFWLTNFQLVDSHAVVQACVHGKAAVLSARAPLAERRAGVARSRPTSEPPRCWRRASGAARRPR